MLPDAVPIDVTSTTRPPAPTTHRPRRRVRRAIVVFVALLAVVAGASVLARHRPGAAGAEKLADRLVDPGGRTTSVSMSLDPETGQEVVFYSVNGPGERWTVSRNWNAPGTNRGGGYLNLTEYETEDQAMTGFARVAEAMRLASLTPQAVPGHPEASFEVGEMYLTGAADQPVAGAGVKGTIVVWGMSTTDTVEWLRQIFIEQFGRLP